MSYDGTAQPTRRLTYIIRRVNCLSALLGVHRLGVAFGEFANSKSKFVINTEGHTTIVGFADAIEHKCNQEGYPVHAWTFTRNADNEPCVEIYNAASAYGINIPSTPHMHSHSCV